MRTDRSQPDAGAVVAAVDHAQIPTDATCPGELRRFCPRLGLADGLGGKSQQNWCFGLDACNAGCRRLQWAGIGGQSWQTGRGSRKVPVGCGATAAPRTLEHLGSAEATTDEA